jgi:hypothetical protein
MVNGSITGKGFLTYLANPVFQMSKWLGGRWPGIKQAAQGYLAASISGY